jgi:hypothetical protein
VYEKHASKSRKPRDEWAVKYAKDRNAYWKSFDTIPVLFTPSKEYAISFEPEFGTTDIDFKKENIPRFSTKMVFRKKANGKYDDPDTRPSVMLPRPSRPYFGAKREEARPDWSYWYFVMTRDILPRADAYETQITKGERRDPYV